MSDSQRYRSRATVDAVLAREGLDPDEEIRDRLARQLATMDAYRARLRTTFPPSSAARADLSDADRGPTTTRSSA